MINENETTESLGPITISFGKFQGPHIGHHAATQFGKKYASDNGMEFRVYTSNRHMKKLKTPRPHPETPLSPEQKAKHLPRVLGVDKVHFEESPYSTIEKLLAAGHSHVHIILGSDRMEDTAPGLREKYGDRVVPVQFGEKRSEGKKGIAGASSTKMREHARTNNFEAFRGILPGHVSEEHAREMFSDIRGGLAAAKEKLDEEVSAQTRMKLSRIAKRTAKLRAAKRKARQRRRRNIKQLKGRAKQDIKNQLRHRYFKGTWQKLGFSTRARIDANVNKRKKIADSMVRRILPDVVRGENERLKRVSLRRESIEDVLLPLLLEARIGSKKAGSGPGANSASSRAKARMRKQKQRGKIKSSKKSGNVTGHYAVVRATSGKYAGDVMVVDKNSYDPNQHEIVVAPDKFSISSGQKIIDDADFIQTDSSIKLYGNQKGAKVAKLGKPKKAKTAEFAEKKKKTPTQQQKAAQSAMMPKKPSEWDLEEGSIEPKKKQSKNCSEPTSHDAKIVEPAMAVFANMQNGIDPEKQVEMGLLDKNTMMAIIKNQHKSLHPSAEKMGRALVERYGPGVHFKVTGSKMEGVELNKDAIKGGIVDKTAKADLHAIDTKTGEIVDTLSVKCGSSQAASGNYQDSTVALEWTLDNAQNFGVSLSKETKKDVENIIKFLSDPNEYAGNETTDRGPTGLYKPTGALAGKDPTFTKKENANKKLTDMLDKAFARSPELLALYALTQMAGYHKFKEGNNAIARTMISVSHDGNQAKIAPIDLELSRKLKIDIASRIKSGSAASKQQEEEWDQLQEQAKKQGKELTDLDDFRPYGYRNTIRVTIGEIDLSKLNAKPLREMSGVSILKLLIEKTKEPPPQPTDAEMQQNFEEMKEIAEQDPMQILQIITPLFDVEDISPTLDFLDILPVDGYTINRIFINGKEFRIPVQKPINNPIPGMDVSALGEEYLKEKRNYRKEYDNYHSKPEQRKNRAGRVKARRLMMKLGKVRKGDGKDVDHKDSNPKNNGKHNLRVRDKSSNRADND